MDEYNKRSNQLDNDEKDFADSVILYHIKKYLMAQMIQHSEEPLQDEKENIE